MKNTLLIIFGLFPLLLMSQEIPQTQSDSTAFSHPKVVGKISLEGNRITQSNIIFREIIIKQGDTLTKTVFNNRLEQSRLNLLNTALFNFVIVDTTTDISGVTNLKFSMVERWYLFPFPIFEISDRNFNAWMEHKDWRRVNYGAFIKWSNLRGRMEVLNLLIRFGYDEKYRLIYDIPYINQNQTVGLTLLASINQNHEVAYQTIDNKPVFYRGENYMLQDYFISTGLNYRPSIFNYYSAIIGYDRYHYDSQLLAQNSAYAPVNSNQLDMFIGTFYYRNDHRDSKAYPLQGFYTDAELTTQNGGYNNKQIFSNSYLSTNLSIFDRFTQRWSWSAGTTLRVSRTKNVPYFLNQGLGYHRDYVRGYEYYVIDGGNYLLARSNIKYNIFKPHSRNLKITGTDKFDKIHYAVYFNIFADLGEDFSPPPNEAPSSVMTNTTQLLNNKLLRGIGVGLDLVTYYDKVLRFEYSVNHFGQSGFYIHFDSSL